MTVTLRRRAGIGGLRRGLPGSPGAAVVWLAVTLAAVGQSARGRRRRAVRGARADGPRRRRGQYEADLDGLGSVRAGSPEARQHDDRHRVRRTAGSGRGGHRPRQHRHRPDDQGAAHLSVLEMGAMVGIDPASDGLARAARLGVADHRRRGRRPARHAGASPTSAWSSTPLRRGPLANAAELAPHGKRARRPDPGCASDRSSCRWSTSRSTWTRRTSTWSPVAGRPRSRSSPQSRRVAPVPTARSSRLSPHARRARLPGQHRRVHRDHRPGHRGGRRGREARRSSCSTRPSRRCSCATPSTAWSTHRPATRRDRRRGRRDGRRRGGLRARLPAQAAESRSPDRRRRWRTLPMDVTGLWSPSCSRSKAPDTTCPPTPATWTS